MEYDHWNWRCILYAPKFIQPHHDVSHTTYYIPNSYHVLKRRQHNITYSCCQRLLYIFNVLKKAHHHNNAHIPHTPQLPSGGLNGSNSLSQIVVKVRGLVEGGVHLLLLDMVSDTLNAKAAVYAIKDCKKGWKVWSLEKKKWEFGKNSEGWPSFFVLGGWIWWEGTAWAEVWKFGWGCWWGWDGFCQREKLVTHEVCLYFSWLFLFGFMRRWWNMKEIVT